MDTSNPDGTLTGSPFEGNPWGQPYDREFKPRAVELAIAGAPEKSGAALARELGVPQATLYDGMAATQADPVPPFIGRGHLQAEDQAVRDGQRRVKDLEAEHAILKKARRLVPHDRQYEWPSSSRTASPVRFRRWAASCKSRAADMMRGGGARRVPEPRPGSAGRSASEPCSRPPAHGTGVPNARLSSTGRGNA